MLRSASTKSSQRPKLPSTRRGVVPLVCRDGSLLHFCSAPLLRPWRRSRAARCATVHGMTAYLGRAPYKEWLSTGLPTEFRGGPFNSVDQRRIVRSGLGAIDPL